MRHAKTTFYSALGLAGALLVTPALAEVDTDNNSTTWSVNEPQGEFFSVEIDTNSGTWMSVDISPDGEYVVFDLLGDIYRMPASGGNAELLRGGIAWHMQPAYSPDGQYIAYTSDENGGDNIWVMRADGSDAYAVTNETFRLLNSPAWSPDGNYIAARKHFTARRSLGAGEIWMYHRLGGDGVQLTERPNDQKDLGEPAFSPDGRYVYFSQDVTPGDVFEYSKDSVAGIYAVRRYDLQSGEIDTVLSGMGGAIRPVPSPDGRYLAYVGRDDFHSTLYLYDLSTGEQRKIDAELSRDMQETWAVHGVYPQMGWTEDSHSLVFYAKGGLHRLNASSGDVSAIPFRVQTEKQVQTALRFRQPIENDTFDVRMLRHATASADGTQLTYEALGYLYQVEPGSAQRNGEPRRLTAQTERFEQFPAYSRDGHYLLYTTWHDQEQGQIILRDLRSGSERVLPTGKGKFVEPQFAPDGESIIYRKIRGGYLTDPTFSVKPGLYHLRLDADEPEFLTAHGSDAHFGASSDTIYYTAQGPSLRALDINSGNTRTLYTSEHATEFKVSPDGQYLAFAEGFRVYITPLVEHGSSLVISPRSRQFPVERLSERAGENIAWTSDSSQLYWTLGPELYSASLDGIFDIRDNGAVELAHDGTNIGFSQSVYVPEHSVAFVGATVVTMNGDEVIEDAVLVVEGNQITEVGPRGMVHIPRGAEQIDVSGKTIIPGLIDVHAHGAQGENQIIPQHNWALYASLTFGVTTIHDPSNNTRQIFAASEMQRAGQIVGPRIFSTGTILYGANGPGFTARVDSLDDARFHVERLQKAGAFSVKSYNQPRRDQRQQFIQAARELDMMVMPEGGSLYQHNLSMVADGHTTIEHSIPVATMYDDVLQLWRATEVAYVPTLGVAYGGIWGENYWYAESNVWEHPRLSQFVPPRVLRPRSMRRDVAPDHHYNHFRIAAGAKALQDEGVLVAAGAHGQREGLAQHWEIWMMEQGGMTPLQALRTATLDAAKTLGMDHAIGSIERGKLADLAIIDGNVLSDLRVSDRVTHVMVNGRLFDAETMQEIGPDATIRPPFFFE